MYICPLNNQNCIQNRKVYILVRYIIYYNRRKPRSNTMKKLILNKFEKNTCEKAIAEIKGSFVWSESDEGADYWVTVCEKLEKYIDRKAE